MYVGTDLFESGTLCSTLTLIIYLFFVGLDEERSLQFLARILDAAVLIKKRKVQLRRTTRDLGTRVAN
jgi:hypothetical protein